ncbi:MAG: IS1595 family transposase [Deltaproteobacteria bacterium]|nr:IS1595 family transposase [Deltaproteobacteria bacterium]
MQEYPKNQLEFERQFPTEQSCRQYLMTLRWPDGFRCSKCGNQDRWDQGRNRITCTRCRHETSVLAGTLFHRSHLSLEQWFRAAWWVTNQKHGVSALGLQRTLGIGSYETAWTVLQKLRRAMVRQGRDLLSGDVEVDETFVGGSKPGKRGRGAEGKKLVVIATEIDGKKIGRIRMRHIPDASASSLEGFIKDSIAKGSGLVTDQWGGYNGVKSLGYGHKRVDGEVVGIEEVVPRVHRVASLLKRWLMGTLHGRFEPKHLDRYLEEFTFRFNRRTSNYRGLLFYRLLENSVIAEPVPYTKIINGKSA